VGETPGRQAGEGNSPRRKGHSSLDGARSKGGKVFREVSVKAYQCPPIARRGKGVLRLSRQGTG